jgi:hypothetical protein
VSRVTAGAETPGVSPVREEPVPNRLPGAATQTPLIDAKPGAVLLRVPLVGRFLVTAQDPVLFERRPGATDADRRCFLDEPVAAAARILRGDLVLRASCVSVGGAAVAVCGPPAAGKSALAAALARRGHPVLADAVTAVAAQPVDLPTVSAVAPQLALWPDTAAELELDGHESRIIRPAIAKRAYALGPPPAPAPVGMVVFLSADVTRTEPAVEAVEGMEKLQALLAARWHGRHVDALGLEAAHFGIAARLAGVRCVRLARPRRGTSLDALAQLVEELAL